MKIAIITDTHWGVRGSSENFLEFFKNYYTNVFFPYLVKNDIKVILHGGDVFDNRRNVNAKVFDYFIKYFADEAAKHGISVFGIIGNHDCYNKSDNDIALVQGLANVIDNRNNDISFKFASEPYRLKIEDFEIDLIPWVNAQNYESTMEFVNSSQSKYCLGHFEFAGFTMYKNSVAHEGMDASLFKKYDKVMSGHFHQPSASANVIYLGSPYDTTWQDFGEPRGFTVLDTTDGGMKYIRTEETLFTEIKYQAGDEEDITKYKDKFVRIIVDTIKDDDRKVHNKELDKFVKALELVAHDVKIVDNTIKMVTKDSIDETAMLQDTSAVFGEYISKNVEEKLQSPVLKFMTDLYNEALELHD